MLDDFFTEEEYVAAKMCFYKRLLNIPITELVMNKNSNY